MNNNEKKCDICDITSDFKSIIWCNKANMFLCPKHKRQFYRYGYFKDNNKRTTHDKNNYIIKTEIAKIELYNNKGDVKDYAIIDIEDVDRCKQYKWYLTNGYVETKINKKKMRLTRFLLNYDGELFIDHINRNTLDNRKINLRIVPNCVNCANKEAVGVTLLKNNKWFAYFQRCQKRYSVGIFDSKQEAIEARKKAVELFDNASQVLVTEYLRKIKNIPTGVLPSPSGKWIANLYKDNKSNYLGTFKHIEEAIEAIEKARQNAENKILV